MEGGQDFLDAFWRLDRDRVAAYSIGPIPYTAMIEYARWHGYEGDEFEMLCTCLVAMDATRIELASAPEELDEFRPGMMGGGRHTHSERPMTMELFDALFDH